MPLKAPLTVPLTVPLKAPLTAPRNVPLTVPLKARPVFFYNMSRTKRKENKGRTLRGTAGGPVNRHCPPALQGALRSSFLSLTKHVLRETPPGIHGDAEKVSEQFLSFRNQRQGLVHDLLWHPYFPQVDKGCGTFTFLSRSSCLSQNGYGEYFYNV